MLYLELIKMILESSTNLYFLTLIAIARTCPVFLSHVNKTSAAKLSSSISRLDDE